MGERPTIAFRVDQAQKDEWESYAAEQPEYDSLSHLIRVAVAHEMSDHYGQQQSGGDSSVSSEGVGVLQTSINDIEGQLDEFEEILESVEKGVYGDKTVLADDTLTNVYNRLPYSSGMTTGEVASKEQLSEKRAAMALEALTHDTGAVERTIDDGEIRYSRKEITEHPNESPQDAGTPDSMEDIDL